MFANSEFVALLKQANTDSSKMAEVIGVSEAQLRFVTNTASGMGLIKCGSVVILIIRSVRIQICTSCTTQIFTKKKKKSVQMRIVNSL